MSLRGVAESSKFHEKCSAVQCGSLLRAQALCVSLTSTLVHTDTRKCFVAVASYLEEKQCQDRRQMRLYRRSRTPIVASIAGHTFQCQIDAGAAGAPQMFVLDYQDFRMTRRYQSARRASIQGAGSVRRHHYHYYYSCKPCLYVSEASAVTTISTCL